MKKYAKLLPFILYPYSYLIEFFLLAVAGKLLSDAVDGYDISASFLCLLFIYHLFALASAIYGAVSMARNCYTAHQVTEMLLVIKCCQLPGYLLHYLTWLLGKSIPFFGLALMLYAVVVNVVTVILAGIFSIGCIIKLKREQMLSVPVMILAIVGSFLYGVDYLIAIAVFFKTKS